MDKTTNVEISAKTVEEATELGIKELNVLPNEVQVDVISEAKPGILGFGSAMARVRVSIIPAGRSIASSILEIVTELLHLTKAEATAKISNAGEHDDDPVEIDIQGIDSGLLIGRKGETLRDLQFLVNYLANKINNQRVLVILDIEGYKARRDESLQLMAERLATKVVNTGKPITLEPMPPRERRTIHIALANRQDIQTESIGEGDQRQVTIIPSTNND